MAPTETEPIALSTIVIRGVTALLLGMGVNATIVWVALQLPPVEPFGPLSYGPVLFLTGLGTVAATAVYGLITRVWPTPDDLFVRIAILALLGSFLPTLGILYADPEATVSAVIVLLVMHVTTALICIGLLTDRYSPIGTHAA